MKVEDLVFDGLWEEGAVQENRRLKESILSETVIVHLVALDMNCPIGKEVSETYMSDPSGEMGIAGNIPISTKNSLGSTRNQLRLIEFFVILWKWKLILVIVTAAIVEGSIDLANVLPSVYASKTTPIPSSVEGGSGLSGYASLTMIVGITQQANQYNVNTKPENRCDP